MAGSLFLDMLPVHGDWELFLSEKVTKELSAIEKHVVSSGYTPDAGKVLRFLTFPLSSARVIILGQDPYPQPGVATGRAFEVGNLVSWSQPFTNISLKNILRAVYKAYSGEVINYSSLKRKFDNEFPVLPPRQLFQHWESQGVLMLNTSFTCEPWKPGSHYKLWKNFTFSLLEFIAEQAAGATWFLWGNHALEATRQLNLKKRIETLHPMMCYSIPSRTNDFLYGEINCFSQYADEIDWTGYPQKGEFKISGRLF
jgi:uracil-DNA glycosylase